MPWTYEIDPAFDPRGEIPPEAVVAGAPCDDEGNIAGPWRQNPNYRPSVLAKLLKTLPSDEFLLAFGAYLRGEISTDRFADVFHQTEFDVLSNDAGSALLLVEEGSAIAYSLYTSSALLAGQASPSTVQLSGSEIATHSQDCEGLLINRSEDGALWLPMAEVVRRS
ncbi:hypothetical protein [Leifsonia aquatica]|uniref:hypothetical protein n=1 Tax=Leifsonia aquatica TaxID=144185 RepID=UPI0038075AB8